MEEKYVPFLISNKIYFVSLFLFIVSNLSLHSDGVKGVARFDGSSKGRCEKSPSN